MSDQTHDATKAFHQDVDGLPFEALDELFAKKGYMVHKVEGEWVWVDDAGITMHGTPYTKDQAYIDALRSLFGLGSFLDDKKGSQ